MKHVANPVEAIFAQAIAQGSREAREAYLQNACGDDSRLRARVEALLKAHDRAGNFMNSDEPEDTLDQPPNKPRRPPHKVDASEGPGTVIGAYKLLQLIGEGGFGVVYMAEQETPVRRRVALKVIKAGMDTRAVIARFEAERQALAMMDHPNIARVLDAGATAMGRPYFVMELVKGIPITQYCDEACLDTRQRLELFIDVCRAVQHAHQKGVIHRDLKPSNIMITLHDDRPVVKVIDFGIAKATDQRLTEKTLFTNYGQMIGTPTYMSPEQAVMSGLDVDTRSDIYSLGVLLYELLTGSPPFDAKALLKAGFDEMRRIIREQQPHKPSTRVSTLAEDVRLTVANQRHASPQLLRKQLHGDLDWIVLKAIEKDRTRRYETANGLAADLKRHLAKEPVNARPPSTVYRFQKAMSRNKVAFGAGVAVVMALLIGIAASAWQAVRATGAEKRVTAALDELRASAPAFAEQARALASREKFDEAIEKLNYALKLRPSEPEYYMAKADLLQCQFKFAEARNVYLLAQSVKPELGRVQESIELCQELQRAPRSADGKLPRESLAKLHVAMQKQQRPAAELMPVARLLGEEKSLLLEYWLARFKDLPVSAEKPLKDRLTVREDGRLALDLSDTKVVDLSPLAGAPLAVLNVSASKAVGELSDLTPLRGTDLVELNITGTSVSDLSPLRDMRTLEKLDMAATKVSDLGALGALRLKSLQIHGCAIRDLTPIRKMPLEEINLRATRVADLSPLIGMPIKSIDLTFAPVLDFSALAELPLEKCYFQRNRITDLSVLRGKSLKELVLWGCVDARNFAVLPEIKTLELLLLPSEYRQLPPEDYAAIGALRNHPNLRQIGSEIMNQMGYSATGSKDIFWQDWDREQSFLPALRASGLTFSLHKRPTGTYGLAMRSQPLRDLSMLKGAPISNLDVSGCPISDLTPIRELPLEAFYASSDELSDLSPLRGMPLTTVYLSGSKIVDLSPLAGLPLKKLYVSYCQNLTDVAAISDISTLENVTVPMWARNIDSLRKLSGLQRLGFTHTSEGLPNRTAAEFWKDCDANPWIAGLRDAGLKPKTARRLEDGTWEVSLSGIAELVDLKLLKGAPISRLWLSKTGVVELGPLRGMPLKTLYLEGTAVSDVGPLQGMRLEELSLANTKVSDLSALRGMPLTFLNAGTPAISDLTPLRGIAMKRLFLTGTAVTDLSPLQGMPLEMLSLSSNTSVSDLSVLRGMPLTELRLRVCNAITNLSPLEDCKRTLRLLILPPNATNVELLRGFPNFERISFADDPKNNFRPDKTATEFWQEFDQQGWLRKLRESGAVKTSKQLADGTWELDLTGSNLSDLAILQGAPISSLNLGRTAVSDFGPLRGMSLRYLNATGTKGSDVAPLRGMAIKTLKIDNTKVADLRPLSGMPLENLGIQGTPVTDLTPLRGMPLKYLYLGDTEVADLEPLRGMELDTLWLYRSKVKDFGPLKGMPLKLLKAHGCTELADLSALSEARQLTSLSLPDSAKDLECLRGLVKLQRLSFTEDAKNGNRPDRTAAEFWREYDSRGAHAHARASRWVEARKGFERSIALHPDDHFSRYMLAVLLAHLDDREAYRASCREMVERYAKTSVPEVMERTAKSCLLLPLDGADVATAARLADKAATFTSNQYIPFFRFAHGFAQYRGRDYLAADATLSQLAKTEGNNYVAVARVCVLAMVQHHLGKTQEAKASLALADTRVKENLPNVDAADLGNSWNDVLIARMLFNEARELIEKK